MPLSKASVILQRLMKLIRNMKRKLEPVTTIELDAMKSFDAIEWDYLYFRKIWLSGQIEQIAQFIFLPFIWLKSVFYNLPVFPITALKRKYV